jgi:hypothetical protein
MEKMFRQQNQLYLIIEHPDSYYNDNWFNIAHFLDYFCGWGKGKRVFYYRCSFIMDYLLRICSFRNEE